MIAEEIEEELSILGPNQFNFPKEKSSTSSLGYLDRMGIRSNSIIASTEQLDSSSDYSNNQSSQLAPPIFLPKPKTTTNIGSIIDDDIQIQDEEEEKGSDDDLEDFYDVKIPIYSSVPRNHPHTTTTKTMLQNYDNNSTFS